MTPNLPIENAARSENCATCVSTVYSWHYCKLELNSSFQVQRIGLRSHFKFGSRFEQNEKGSEAKRREGAAGIDLTVSCDYKSGLFSLSPEPLLFHAISASSGFFPNISHLFDSLGSQPGDQCEEKWRKICLQYEVGSFHDPITRYCNRGKSHIWPCRIGRFEYVGKAGLSNGKQDWIKHYYNCVI